jgi:hypothetical protein
MKVKYKIFRGGSFDQGCNLARSACNASRTPSIRLLISGIRLTVKEKRSGK